MIDALNERERDERRMPRAIGAGWVMLAPECAAEGCTKGAWRLGLYCCAEHSFGRAPIKERWLRSEPDRWRAIADMCRR